MIVNSTRRPATNRASDRGIARHDRKGARLLLRAGGFVGLGVVTLALAGFPRWAARRILYPVGAEPLPGPGGPELGLEINSRLGVEKVTFESTDGQPRGGWFVPAPDTTPGPWPAVALVYGYGGYKEQMVGYAQLLHAGGFATLMFDMQGSGTTRGLPITLGYKERYDLSGACRYLASRGDVDPGRIGVLGVSMGAATALLAAAEEPLIKAVVSDSAYASIERMIRPGLEAFLGRAAVPFAPLIIWHAENITGAHASDIVPEYAVTELGDRPLLVIHGQDDQLIAVESAHRIYAAAPGPKELWIVPNCAHADAPAVAPQEYEERVVDFFRRSL